MPHADKTRQEYIDNWNDNFPLKCGPVTLFHLNTMITALRERQAAAFGFAEKLLFDQHICHVLEPTQSIEDIRFRILEILDRFYDPLSNGGLGTEPWGTGDRFFAAAGIGDPLAPEFDKWTNVPDRLGLTPVYVGSFTGPTFGPCAPLFREQFNELFQAIKTLDRISVAQTNGVTRFVRGISDLLPPNEALDAAQAAAKADTTIGTLTGSGGYHAGHDVPRPNGDVIYTVDYRSIDYQMGPPIDDWDNVPAELVFDNLTMSIKFQTTGLTNNGNGPTIDEGFILGIMPDRNVDDIPDSLTGARRGAIYKNSDGTGVVSLPWAVGKVTPPHFFPYKQTDDKIRVVFQIEDYEGDRNHESANDAWPVGGSEAALYATVTNFDFQ